MDDSPAVYRLSGKPGPALVGAPIAGACAGLVLGVLYAYLDVYIPIAGIVTVLLTLGFTFGLGFTVGAVGRKLRCRSSMFLGLVGLFAAVVALYSSWVAFEFALLRRDEAGADVSFLALLLQPDVVWGIAKGINETGWFTISGSSPSGIFLWILWGIEGAVVLLGTPLIAMSRLTGAVFCEHCSTWAAEPAGPTRLRMPGVDTTGAVTKGDVTAIAALPAAHEGEDPHLALDLRRCCDKTATYALEVVRYEADKKGQVTEKKTALGLRRLASPETWKRLAALPTVIGSPAAPILNVLGAIRSASAPPPKI